MNEAVIAWGGGRTKTGRGISAGAGRAAYVFVLDLLWLLPGLLLMAAVSAHLRQSSPHTRPRMAAMRRLVVPFALTLITVLCCIFCLTSADRTAVHGLCAVDVPVGGGGAARSGRGDRRGVADGEGEPGRYDHLRHPVVGAESRARHVGFAVYPAVHAPLD